MDEIGKIFDAHRRDEKCIQNFCEGTVSEETTYDSRPRWENIIEMDFKGMGYEDIDWIYLDQSVDQWWILMKTV